MSEVNGLCVLCAHVRAVSMIYGNQLYGCDSLWHPRLILHRISNFTVTVLEKLDSGDNIKTRMSYLCCTCKEFIMK